MVYFTLPSMVCLFAQQRTAVQCIDLWHVSRHQEKQEWCAWSLQDPPVHSWNWSSPSLVNTGLTNVLSCSVCTECFISHCFQCLFHISHRCSKGLTITNNASEVHLVVNWCKEASQIFLEKNLTNKVVQPYSVVVVVLFCFFPFKTLLQWQLICFGSKASKD